MNFYMDESGDFRVPDDKGTHAIGIVVGVVVPDETEQDVFRRFDEFLQHLPPSAFQNGEPKGRLLDERNRRLFSDLVQKLDSILVCPIMLDLTALAGNDSHVRSAVVEALRGWATRCKHQTMREQVELLARQFDNVSTAQALRLVTWARCIMRCVQDSLIWHSSPNYHGSWARLRFVIDAVQRQPGSREEQVFETMLPAWVTGWSVNTPLVLVQEIHTPDHPFISRYDTPAGIDFGKMIRGNMHFSASTFSRGLQLADMAAAIVSEATRGLASAVDLENYGLMMTRSIGRPLEATGLFSIVEPAIEDWKRRFYGLPEAIDAVKKVLSRMPPGGGEAPR
jgi:hypothetical protein